MKNTFLSFILLCLSIITLAQNNQKTDSLLLAMEKTNKTDIKIGLLISLTNEFINNNPDEALNYATLAYNLALENDDAEKMAVSLNRLGKIHQQKTELIKAMDYATEAYEIAKKLELRTEMIYSMNTIGYIYNYLGEYNKSSAFFFKSLKLSEEINDKSKIAYALNNIGFTHFDQQNYVKALEYFLKSLSISRDINDKLNISGSLNNVAAAYGAQGKIEKLIPYTREAIRLNKEIGLKNYLIVNYMNLGYYYQEKDNYDSIMYYYTIANDLAEEIDNTFLALSIRQSMAQYFFDSGHFDKSLEETLEVFRLSENQGLKKIMLGASGLLEKTYLAKDDLLNAYHYSTLHNTIKDSLNLEKKDIELSKLELLYEIEKSKQEKEFEQQRKDYIYLLIGIGLISFLGFILTLFYRHKAKARIMEVENQKLETEIDFKNKEMATNVMSLMKKNEMLSEFSSRLIQVEKEAVNVETRFAIKKISQGLKKTIESKVGKEFELRFKEVHAEFFHKLMQKYPKLTPNEQRLCAFLRLNLSTKEISELTGQSTNAIEMARHRLRKKLNISGTDENLISFLSQI